jgi:hypothetical protein
VTNTLAYCDKELVTALKWFIVQTTHVTITEGHQRG